MPSMPLIKLTIASSGGFNDTKELYQSVDGRLNSRVQTKFQERIGRHRQRSDSLRLQIPDLPACEIHSMNERSCDTVAVKQAQEAFFYTVFVELEHSNLPIPLNAYVQQKIFRTSQGYLYRWKHRCLHLHNLLQDMRSDVTCPSPSQPIALGVCVCNKRDLTTAPQCSSFLCSIDQALRPSSGLHFLDKMAIITWRAAAASKWCLSNNDLKQFDSILQDGAKLLENMCYEHNLHDSVDDVLPHHMTSWKLPPLTAVLPAAAVAALGAYLLYKHRLPTLPT